MATEVIKLGFYKTKGLDGTPISWMWNVKNLRMYYQ